MSLETVADLIAALRRHGLLEPPQLDEVTRSLRATFAQPRPLAEALVMRDWLTPYQVRELFEAATPNLALGPYLLLEPLGEGSLGQVFKARQHRLGRIVALKILRNERLGHPDAVRRFLREAQAAAQLNHAHVVFAYDADQVGDVHLLATEYLEGTNLAALVKQRGPLPVDQACDYIRQAALGLAYAHSRGLVHRNLKPSNLFLTARGSLVKLLDLGLARWQWAAAEDSARTLTPEGSLIGTPDYIAPEQAVDAQRADIRADLYSLGCTFYYLLTGRPPFPGGSLTEKLLKHQFEEPQPLEQIRPEVPPRVAAVVRRLLAKAPKDRFQTPAELAEALSATNGSDRGETVPTPAQTGTEPIASIQPRQGGADCQSAPTTGPEELFFPLSTVLQQTACNADRAATAPNSDPGETAPTPARTDAESLASEELLFPLSTVPQQPARGAGRAATLPKGRGVVSGGARGASAMKKWRLPLIAGICVSLLGIVCLLVFFLGGQDAELQESASRAPKDSKPSAVKKDSAVKRDPIAKQDTVVKRDPPVKKDAVVKRDQAVKKEAVVKRDRPLATVAGPRLTNTLGMQFVQIPAGKFRMGSLASEMGHKEEEEPAHEVSISKPFFMGVHPVTIGNFRDFVRATGYKTEAEQGQGAYRWNSTNREEELDPKCSWQAPGWSQANDHPVVCVSWNDAQAFCRWLSKKEGRAYRLPSEAEYEYACRAGSQTSYSFGDDPAALGRHAWYAENAAGQAHPVGQLQPNAWGLYDIQGNVWTWCTDFYDSDYYHSSPAQDPPGAAGGDMRSVRGGSWNFPASCCRAAFRDSYSQGKPGNHIGFRVVFPAAP